MEDIVSGIQNLLSFENWWINVFFVLGFMTLLEGVLPKHLRGRGPLAWITRFHRFLATRRADKELRKWMSG
jgi:hypothetical protein